MEESKLKIVLVDDSSDAREVLKDSLNIFWQDYEILGEAHDINSAKALIEAQQPDLVFLDIDLNGEHGFDLLSHFPKPSFQVIFCTGFDNYAIDAFRVNAVDYLLKPIDPEALVAALEKVRKIRKEGNIRSHLQNISSLLHNQQEEKILLSNTEGTSLVEINKIICIDGEGSYSTFFIENEDKIIVSKNLKYYENLLDNSLFFRSHQSHLVNLNFIKTILPTQQSLLLKSGKEVPLARAKKGEINELLKKHFKS